MLYIRYATTTQSLRSIASSATALVRSTVRRTEFICRRMGSKGASNSTASALAGAPASWDIRYRSVAHTQCCRSSYLPMLRDIYTVNNASAIHPRAPLACWECSQLPHGAYYRHGEGRSLVRGISTHTHLECTSGRRTKHWTIKQLIANWSKPAFSGATESAGWWNRAQMDVRHRLD